MVLEDASGNVFFNWSINNVTSGEVYFTRYADIDFDNILDPAASFVPYVQNRYGIANISGKDNLTSTFIDGTHTSFSVGTIAINPNTPRVITYNYTGDPIFETILLREGGVNRDLYASIVNQNQASFNGAEADFQALLPIDSRTGYSTYYVYAEIT